MIDEAWIYIPNTNNRYICSSYLRASVFDRKRNQFRLLSGVFSSNNKHYYLVRLSDGTLTRFYTGYIRELFNNLSEDTPLMYFTTEAKARETQIIQKFLNGTSTKELCDTYDLTYKKMSILISNNIGYTNYKNILSVRRRERFKKDVNKDNK